MRSELRMPVEPLARVLVRNKAIDLLRRTLPDSSIDGMQLASEEPPPTDGIERMMGIIETLPSMQQTILRLRHIDRKSTRLNSSHANISYVVFCLKKKKH